MLVNIENAELYPEWHDFIQDEDTRKAFRYIIGLAACVRSTSCQIYWKGEVRAVRLNDKSGARPYSFITNQRWLLFYFRNPAIRSGAHDRGALEKLFETFNETPKGEWTVKLRGIADVERLADYLGWTIDKSRLP